jgi:hypothetical protein
VTVGIAISCTRGGFWGEQLRRRAAANGAIQPKLLRFRNCSKEPLVLA